MELTVYDIIIKPIISDKAYKLNKVLKQIMLEVHVKANKPMIKHAFETLFDVKVDTVRTSIRKNRNTRSIARRFDANPSEHRQKIAYITLAEGYSLNFFEQMGAGASAQQSEAA